MQSLSRWISLILPPNGSLLETLFRQLLLLFITEKGLITSHKKFAANLVAKSGSSFVNLRIVLIFWIFRPLSFLFHHSVEICVRHFLLMRLQQLLMHNSIYVIITHFWSLFNKACIFDHRRNALTLIIFFCLTIFGVLKFKLRFNTFVSFKLRRLFFWRSLRMKSEGSIKRSTTLLLTEFVLWLWKLILFVFVESSCWLCGENLRFKIDLFLR